MSHTVSGDLAAFTESSFTHDGLTRSVYSRGTGPAVIVIHEIPGLHPGVVEFAERVVDAGFSVRMPSLFGTPGRPVSVPYAIESLARACVAREFTAFALEPHQPGDRLAAAPRRRGPRRVRRARASARSACASPAGSPSG